MGFVWLTGRYDESHRVFDQRFFVFRKTEIIKRQFVDPAKYLAGVDHKLKFLVRARLSLLDNCHELAAGLCCLGRIAGFIGVGESIDDLRPFGAKEFVNALFR